MRVEKKVYHNKINKKKHFGIKSNIKKYEKIIKDTFSEKELMKIVKNFTGIESRQADLKRSFFELLKSSAIADIMNLLEKSFDKGGKRVLNTKGKNVKLGKVMNKSGLAFMRNRQLNHLSNIADKTAEKVDKTLTKGFQEGWGMDKITKSIQEDTKTTTKNKAKTIARSEIIKASSIGTKQSMKEAGIEKYMWITAQDNKVCPLCERMHGKKYKVEDIHAPIPVQDTHPNCRCTIVMAD